MLLVLLAALQAAPAAPERFSVLAPVPPQECQERTNEQGDVVVCGDTPALSQRLPLPDERMPSGPTPSNPNLRGTEVLALEGTPCAATQRGCQVGIGPPPELIMAVANAVKDAFTKKTDKRGRVPIDLSGP